MKSDLTILDGDLSYKIQGLFINVSKSWGCNFKEYFYQSALERELIKASLKFMRQPKISLYSDLGEKAGFFMPDLVIEEKIIVEIKAQKNLLDSHIHQLLKYLERSKYQIGYLVNFGVSHAQIIRRIYTNDRKKWFLKGINHERHE